jgi:hypothetical protein
MKLIKVIAFFLLILTNHLSMGQIVSTDSSSQPLILFVCEHGAARSTIAAAYFNKLAKKINLHYTAIFRGTDPDTSLTEQTKKGLQQDGFDIQDWLPQLVTSHDINAASYIITFDCTLPIGGNFGKPVYRWDGIPPISKDYQVARTQIVEKVVAFVKELKDGLINKK